jgi:transposase
MKKGKLLMDIINPHCAGIDIGSRSHFVAVGQDLEDVKEFGVYQMILQPFVCTLKNLELHQ